MATQVGTLTSKNFVNLERGMFIQSLFDGTKMVASRGRTVEIELLELNTVRIDGKYFVLEPYDELNQPGIVCVIGGGYR